MPKDELCHNGQKLNVKPKTTKLVEEIYEIVFETLC
jgi:hypothetical protein